MKYNAFVLPCESLVCAPEVTHALLTLYSVKSFPKFPKFKPTVDEGGLEEVVGEGEIEVVPWAVVDAGAVEDEGGIEAVPWTF